MLCWAASNDGPMYSYRNCWSLLSIKGPMCVFIMISHIWSDNVNLRNYIIYHTVTDLVCWCIERTPSCLCGRSHIENMRKRWKFLSQTVVTFIRDTKHWLAYLKIIFQYVIMCKFANIDTGIYIYITMQVTSNEDVYT